MHSDASTRAVRLAFPAKAEYLALARLALTGICHLTPLEPYQVAELKLAMVEAASGWFVPPPEDDGDRRLDLRFELAPGTLSIALSGPGTAPEAEEEVELRRAIIEATVDYVAIEPGSVRLVKYLAHPAK